MRLNEYQKPEHLSGAPFLKEILWYFLGFPTVRSRLVSVSWLRKLVLGVFGAKIGKGVVIKSEVCVKYPWKLEVGDHSWIGEGVWIDDLAPVRIGSHVCISQGVYLCTGSHDWKDEAFGLITKPITVEDGAWIAAKAIVGPGITIGQGAVLTLGSVATKDLEPRKIYSGNPAQAVRERQER